MSTPLLKRSNTAPVPGSPRPQLHCAYKMLRNPRYECPRIGKMYQVSYGVLYCAFHDSYAKDRCQAFFKHLHAGMRCSELGLVVDPESGRKFCAKHDPRKALEFCLESPAQDEKIKEQAEKREPPSLKKPPRLKRVATNPSTVKQSPVKEKPPSPQNMSVKDRRLSLQKVPAKEQPPSLKKTPSKHEPPSLKKAHVRQNSRSSPSFKEMPTRETSPSSKGMPNKETSPILKEMPTKETSPISKEMPIKENSPSPKEMPIREQLPTLKKVPIKEQPPSPKQTPVREQLPILRKVLVEEQSPRLKRVPTDEYPPRLSKSPIEEQLPSLKKVPAKEHPPSPKQAPVEEQLPTLKKVPAKEQPPSPTQIPAEEPRRQVSLPTSPSQPSPSIWTTPRPETTTSPSIAARIASRASRHSVCVITPREPLTDDIAALQSPTTPVFPRNVQLFKTAIFEAAMQEESKDRIASMYVQCNICLEKHGAGSMNSVPICGHQYRALCLSTLKRKGTMRKYNCSSCRDFLRGAMDE